MGVLVRWIRTLSKIVSTFSKTSYAGTAVMKRVDLFTKSLNAGGRVLVLVFVWLLEECTEDDDAPQILPPLLLLLELPLPKFGKELREVLYGDVGDDIADESPCSPSITIQLGCFRLAADMEPDSSSSATESRSSMAGRESIIMVSAPAKPLCSDADGNSGGVRRIRGDVDNNELRLPEDSYFLKSEQNIREQTTQK